MGRYVTEVPATQASVIKSIQTGYVATGSLSTGSYETQSYLDVTISSVTTGKCVLYFSGSASDENDSNTAGLYSLGNGSVIKTGFVTLTLTSQTNFRINASGQASRTIRGRWTVVEYV